MSPELHLAAACCRFPRNYEASDAIAAALTLPIDWCAFEATVQRHRIAGLVGSALCSNRFEIPGPVRTRLAERARSAALQDLQHAAETVRLQRLFDQANIPAMFLKGVAVGVLAYGRLGIKQSWDIDLLTTEACMMQALALLEQSGYRLVEPAGLPREKLPRFGRFFHEAQLRNDEGVTVELHWRLFSKPILSGICSTSETQLVQIEREGVRTLREDLLIAYLIAHGQEHGWTRLKWLADLNALLVRKSGDELVALYHQVATIGLKPQKAAAAFLLCARLLDLHLPKSLADAIGDDRVATRLVHVSLVCLAHPRSGLGLPQFSPANLALMASRFAQGNDWHELAGELGAVWTQPAARARYSEKLDLLYHLLRLPLLLLRIPAKLLQLGRAAPTISRARER